VARDPHVHHTHRRAETLAGSAGQGSACSANKTMPASSELRFLVLRPMS
jgi:hypothetical protein